MTSGRTRRSRARPTLLVAGIYGASIGMLFLAELGLARVLPSSDFGRYSLARNAIPVVSALTLLGVDQAVTRAYATGNNLGQARRVLQQRLILACPVSLLAGGVTALLGAGWLAAGVVGIGGAAVVTSDLSAAVLRGTGAYARSALVQQGYRLALGVGVIALLLAGLASDIASMLTMGVAALGIAVIGRLTWWRSSELLADADEVRRLNRLGLAFGLSMIPFVVLDWADQALLSTMEGGLSQTGLYAVTKLMAVYPLLSLASIGGFVLMPEVARRADAVTPEAVRRWLGLGVPVAVACSVVWGMLCGLALEALTGRPSDGSVVAILTAVGALRLFYVLPSSFLGALGTTQQIWTASLQGLLALAAMPVTAVVLISLSLRPAVAVATALLVATGIRVAIAVRAVIGLRARAAR